MKDFIEEIWTESLSPIRNVSENEEVFRVYTHYRRSKERLYDSLNCNQKKMFEEMEKMESEYTTTKELEIFKEGFKLGKKFAEL